MEITMWGHEARVEQVAELILWRQNCLPSPNQPPKSTCIDFDQLHLNSPFNVCVLLSSVWVDSHVQLLQLRAGAVPLIAWRQSELLGASSSAWTQSAAHSEWGRASSLHRGPLNSSAPASRRRATATGGQQLLFHNQSAAKKLFSFSRFLLLLAPGWHTYCDINLDLVLLCGFRSFADALKVSQKRAHSKYCQTFFSVVYCRILAFLSFECWSYFVSPSKRCSAGLMYCKILGGPKNCLTALLLW